MREVEVEAEIEVEAEEKVEAEIEVEKLVRGLIPTLPLTIKTFALKTSDSSAILIFVVGNQ